MYIHSTTLPAVERIAIASIFWLLNWTTASRWMLNPDGRLCFGILS